MDKLYNRKLKKGQKRAIVSDIYHLPRVRRTSNKYEIIPEEKIIFYPSEPRIVSISKALKEIRKMGPYIAGDILPEEEIPKEKPKLIRKKRK